MNEIDEIRQEMARIRHDLHQDVAGVVVGATDVMDWRSYLRSRPWLTAGAAFAIGYLLVPKRAKTEIVAIPTPLPTSSAPQPMRAGFLGESTPTASPKRSMLSPWRLMGWAISFAGPIALNAAQAYAASWVEGQLGMRPGEPDGPEPNGSQNRGRGNGAEGRPGYSASPSPGGSRLGRGERGF